MVAVVGPALTALPLGVLRVVVGGLLLVFGLQWLRKAILRAAGSRRFTTRPRSSPRSPSALARWRRHERAGIDRYAFTVSFKGVLLEGSRWCSSCSHSAPTSTGSAWLRSPRWRRWRGRGRRASRCARRWRGCPENALKFAVGVMLTSFGTFWSAEGAGAHWPGGDAALLVIIPGLLIAALTIVSWLRRAAASRLVERSA